MSLRVLFAFLATACAIPSPVLIHKLQTRVAPRQAVPTYTTSNSTDPCGPVAKFYNPGPKDWVNAKTDEWLASWIKDNAAAISNHTSGFAGAFGQYALGDPDFTCQTDGSVNCQVSVCANPVINALGNSTQQAYYVLEAVEHLHAYYMGMGQSFQISALVGSLEKDDWEETFYVQKNGHNADDSNANSMLALKEMLAITVMAVGVALSFVAGPEVAIGAGIAAGSMSSLYGGAVGATNMALQGPSAGNNNFKTSADVGNALGQVVQTSLSSLVNNNNAIMQGKSIDPNNATLTTILQGGSFVNTTVDESGAISNLAAMLQGLAINQMWKLNKVFILGGANCGDNQGIGSGPANFSWCDSDNKAWYIYFWQANDVLSLSEHQWGWTAMPPGADQLGTGDYANITVQDAIKSSVAAYTAGGYNYTTEMAQARAEAALTAGANSPQMMGAGWEGIFSIPVCNISQTVGKNYDYGSSILMQYGHDNRPVWCGPICNNDLDETKAFIHAANMDNFKSPKHICKHSPGY